MLRLPGRALDIEEARRYCCGDSAVARRKKEWVILEFHSDDEDSEWEADGPQLSALIPLRWDLAKGDYRCLYLAWLRCVQAGEIDDDEAEPPVPRGLRTMTGPLDAFVEIMHIERDLLAAAAEHSEDAEELVPRNEIETWIRSLSEAEKVRLLVDAVVAGAGQNCSRDSAILATCDSAGQRKRARSLSCWPRPKNSPAKGVERKQNGPIVSVLAAKRKSDERANATSKIWRHGKRRSG